PAGLTAANSTTSQCGGSLTINSNVISLSGASIVPGGTCVCRVTVTGATGGVKNNTTGAVTSNESGAGATSNTATITVVGPPTISTGFDNAAIPLGGTSALTFTITNPNSTVGLTGVAFTDALPAGLTAADGMTSQCGGTLTINSNLITLSGASM